MTDEECRELGIMTDQEILNMNLKFERMEEVGNADTQKYFDRIHDKLFSLNSFLIAGYFAIVAISNNIPAWTIIIPTVNSIFLLYIDYRMLLRSRLQAAITQISAKDRERYGAIMRSTNLYSLLTIFSTISVVFFFGYFLLTSIR